MFSMKIVDSDAFLEMPQSSQNLYFHLCMRADDDWFVSNPKKIMRMIWAGEDDYKVLMFKRFILVFESWICVIKHRLIHNVIRNDRKIWTPYRDELDTLSLKENQAYTLMSGKWQADVRIDIDKIRLDLDKNKEIICSSDDEPYTELIEEEVKQVIPKKIYNFEAFWTAYPKKESKIGAEKKYIHVIKTWLVTHDKIMMWVEWYCKIIRKEKKEKQYIKQATTRLHNGCWDDEEWIKLMTSSPPVIKKEVAPSKPFIPADPDVVRKALWKYKSNMRTIPT